ncbi:hypothetical protein Tco_0942687 [Tanacetum coccineum]
MCRTLGRIPTVGTFRRIFVNSISNGWLSFSKHEGVDDPCCYSKKFDSLKNWNNRFFLIDASVCPLSTSWFSGTSVVNDPLPVEEAVNLPYVELLNVNQMGLLDFVNSADPFKVKVGEQTLSENELNVNSGKSPTALRRLIRQSEQADAGSGSAVPATEDATSFSVTPTPKRALEDALHDNVRTCPPSGRFVGLSSGSADTNIPTSSQVILFVSSAPTGVNVPVTEPMSDGRPSLFLGLTRGLCLLHRNVTNNARIDNPVTCQNLHDHHVSMVSELRLHYEHEIMTREKYEKKFTDNAAVVQQRDAKIVNLKAQLQKSEAEALTANYDNLRVQVVGKSKMWEEFASLQDTAEQHFFERVTALDARIADVRRDIDNDLYLYMLTAIAYDSEIEGKYVVAVLEFDGIYFPLLDELEGLKDYPLASIMSALTLKDDYDNVDVSLEFRRFQPSLD